MQIRKVINHLKNNPIDAWYYIQGNFRLWAYNSKNFKWLLRGHIIEQFEWRRDVKAHKCYMNGSCVCCGCDTPELFFANKECSVDKTQHCKDRGLTKCYPKMMSDDKWALVPNK